MRLYFHRLTGRSQNTFSAAGTLAQIREEIRFTSRNTGNLVHLESLPKMLRYDHVNDPRGGGFANLQDDRARRAIDRLYDGIVLQYANIIRNYDHLGEEALAPFLLSFKLDAEWIRETKCKVFAFGIGIQDELPPQRHAIPRELLQLLKVLNSRAEVFGVRGKTTEAWLHSLGFTNAQALGCPSLFVYPKNTLGIRSPKVTAETQVVSAGRIQQNAKKERLDSINRIAQHFPTSYIFQTDFFALLHNCPNEQLYNEATGEVSPTPIRRVAEKHLKVHLAFKDYYWFRTVEKWQGFSATKDIYFGDRFHGGVVFLQCARPAVIVYNDARVRELTDFYGIPAVSPSEVLENDPVALLKAKTGEASLDHFRRTYLDRLGSFLQVLRKAGLELFNEAEFDSVLSARVEA